MDVAYLEPAAFRDRLGRTLRDAPVESIAAVKNGRSLGHASVSNGIFILVGCMQHRSNRESLFPPSAPS